MRGALVCTTPAVSAAIVGRDVVNKIFPDLGLADNELDALIEAASEMLMTELNFPRADGEVQSILLQEYEQTILAPDAFDFIQLARRPIVAISSLLSDGISIDVDALLIDKSAGQVFMKDRSAFGCDIVATYTAGYNPPGDPAANVPKALERAVAFMVYQERLQADDARIAPPVKSERIKDYAVTYGDSVGSSATALPKMVQSAIDKFKWKVS